jgi:hypothetical protein
MADRQESHDGWQSLGSERDQNKDGKSDGLDRSAFVHRRHTDDKEHNGKDDGNCCNQNDDLAAASQALDQRKKDRQC